MNRHLNIFSEPILPDRFVSFKYDIQTSIMALIKLKQVQEKDPGRDLQELARQVLVALNGAFKKILLYPPEHIIYQTSLKSLKNGLDKFLDQQGTLALKIDRNKIRYKDEVVHEGPMNEENPAFILFRDGIYHLEFHKSIELWEIHSFLEILQQNQILTEDAEDDVVTALWGLELPSLRYKAEDMGFDNGEDFGIPELGDFEEDAEDEQEPPPTGADDADAAPSLHVPIHDRNLWEITPEDREHLRHMLTEEENGARIEYVLYILLYILQQQTQPGNFSEVMVFLNQELQDAMKGHKYQSVYNTLQILRKNLNAHKARDRWAIPLLQDFFSSLSGKAFLNVMHDDWERIAVCDPKELTYLNRALLLLNPKAIDALGPMLLETKSKQTKKMLMTAIGILAEREFKHLGVLLSSSNTEMVKMLVHVMKFMKSEQSFKQLLELLRHDSEGVRKEALKVIFHRNSYIIGELPWLIYDPDEDIQQLFLNYAGQQRDAKTERLLRDYLEKHRIHSGNKKFLFRVYHSLGRCGSDESIPFLGKNLFFLHRLGILRHKKSLRRQAAVYALKELNTPKAESMLERRSKKLRSNINETFLSGPNE